MTSELSIVIPTYRRTDSLKKLLEALLVQKGVVPEIIVVDQNPTGYLNGVLPEGTEKVEGPGTAGGAKGIGGLEATAGARVKQLVLSAPNVSDARNKGFLASSGEIVLFVDDDLIPEEDFCVKALKVFHDYPEIGCFSPLVYSVTGQTAALEHAKLSYVSTYDESKDIFSITDTITAAILFRREYYERSGGFDPLLFEFAKAAEDQELFLRMRSRKMVLYFVPYVEIFHDEAVAGGCDMRTMSYWVTREKCMRSWAFRRRIHHHPPGRLSAGDLFMLARSGFINREVLLSGVKNISRQVRMLSAAIRSSGVYLKDKLDRYPVVEKVSHLTE